MFNKITNITFKKIVSWLHLWFGLASGLVVFIVAITGAIWCFETEIQDILYSYRNVPVSNQTVLPPSVLKDKVSTYFGSHKVTGIDYRPVGYSAIITHRSNHAGEDLHILAYVNPYSGQVLHVEKGHSFFDIVIELHVNLLLDDVGAQIVDYSTLIFVVLIITGIVLWWPKNKSAAKQRFWFNWKNGLQWKRKNYDLHNILGFYASFVVIFIAITGLAWGFEWVNKSIQYVVSVGDEFKPWNEYQSTSDSLLPTSPKVEDLAYFKSLHAFKQTPSSVNLNFPNDKTGTLIVYVNSSDKTWYTAQGYHYDQRTGHLIDEETFEKLSLGQKACTLYFDIHIGKIFGLTGQFLAFFACLIIASLPITGFLIWWGRRKKGKKSTTPYNKNFSRTTANKPFSKVHEREIIK